MIDGLNVWEQAIAGILDKVGQIAPKADEYIGGDGLPYCKRCNTPRAGIVDKERGLVMYHTCACQQAEREEARRLEEEKQRRHLVEHLRENSMLGEFFRGCTFSGLTITTYNADAVERARKYCVHAEEMLKRGYGIYIYGESGVGKTTLAACIANRLTEQCFGVWFTSISEILNAVKATFETGKSSVAYEKLLSVDFLFLDDVGTEGIKKNDNGWVQATVFDIINRRYNTKKPVVFTSNYVVSDLVRQANFAKRTAQRISEMGTLKLHLGNVNMRRASEEKDREEMEKLLTDD